MKDTTGYEIYKELRFVVRGEEFAITPSDKGQRCFIEETRKNGQEDTHMSGTLVKRDGKWAWEEDWGREQFERYGNDGVADAIPAYLDANPIPESF